MKRIAFHSTKGGVGTTSLAAHLCAVARDGGIRVAGLSLDPTGDLAQWLAPLDIPCLDGLRGEMPTADTEVLVVDINTQIQDLPPEIDQFIIPIDGRMSYEHALRLSDRLPGAVLWLANHVHTPGFCIRFEIPRHLARVQQLLPGVPRSHAIAEAGAERKLVWHTEDGAVAAGSVFLRDALQTVLERAGFTLKSRAPRWYEQTSPEPVADATAVTRKAHAIVASLVDAELRRWPSPGMLDLAREGLLTGLEEHEEGGELDPAVRRELGALAHQLWTAAGVRRS